MSVSPTADISKGDKSMIIKTRDAVTGTNFRTSYAQISDTVNDVLIDILCDATSDNFAGDIVDKISDDVIKNVLNNTADAEITTDDIRYALGQVLISKLNIAA